MSHTKLWEGSKEVSLTRAAWAILCRDLKLKSIAFHLCNCETFASKLADMHKHITNDNEGFLNILLL